MLSPGVETWSKGLLKVGFTRKARVLLGLQGQTPRFRRLDPDARDPSVWPLDSAKLSFALSKNHMGFPFGPDKVFSCPNISGNIQNPFR